MLLDHPALQYQIDQFLRGIIHIDITNKLADNFRQRFQYLFFRNIVLINSRSVSQSAIFSAAASTFISLNRSITGSIKS